MSLGIGNRAIAWSSAFCSPCARVAPVTRLSKNKASALPSMRRASRGTAPASAPSAASFLSSAAVAWPSAPSPTLVGMSFCDTALSGAAGSTALTCAARRRGVA